MLSLCFYFSLLFTSLLSSCREPSLLNSTCNWLPTWFLSFTTTSRWGLLVLWEEIMNRAYFSDTLQIPLQHGYETYIHNLTLKQFKNFSILKKYVFEIFLLFFVFFYLNTNIPGIDSSLEGRLRRLTIFKWQAQLYAWGYCVLSFCYLPPLALEGGE